MNTIKITPEQLQHVSSQVDQARQQLESMRGNLIRQIMFVQTMWMGATQERFYFEFERSSPILEKALESMVKMSTELREIATRFQKADAEQVNLAGGFGAAGAIVATMGKSDSSLEDKGYRMAYNSALHAWLPVNDKGVTDQAALQAYQRDKGNLDVQGMQSAGNTETPGEDIYAMQIKAYESGIHPFSGEPVSDSLAQYMVVSLKLGQVFMAVQGIRSGMPGSKGPYRLPANHPVTAKIQKNIDAAKAKGANAGGNVKEGTEKGLKNKINEQVSDAEKLQRPYDHLVNVDGLKRGGRPGISGGHNMDNFYAAMKEDASKYGLSVEKNYIIGEPKKHSVEGIYEIEYQIPSVQRTEKDKSIFEPIKDSEGNVVGKRVNDPKTVYDPNVISDEKMYNWGKAALEPQIQAGNVKNGIVKGELDGLKFVGFVDENGKIKNFYPTFDYKD